MLAGVQQNVTEKTKNIPRDYGFDNIRAILIAFVVFGHLLEVCTEFSGHRFIYQTIYSFHIPVFIFLVGYFARFDIKKILLNWITPFLIFQVLYITAERFLGNDTPYQFSTPYWHLWFLIVCVFYMLLIPAYETDSFKKQMLALICTAILSLAIGFDKTWGHYMALSRFFVFQPWFLLGFYFRKYSSQKTDTTTAKGKFLRSGISVAVLCVTVVVAYVCDLPDKIFYGSYPYDNIPIDLIYRMIVMSVSFVWVFFFVSVLKPLLQKKIPLLTSLGQNTLPVYILHAFVTKGLSSLFPQLLSSPLYLVLITLVILLLLGNTVMGNIFRFIFSERILKIFSKSKN